MNSFDVDTLQRKDRNELSQIAQALGGKPGSRARKADIIEMILELAGVTSSGAPMQAEGEAPDATPVADNAAASDSTASTQPASESSAEESADSSRAASTDDDAEDSAVSDTNAEQVATKPSPQRSSGRTAPNRSRSPKAAANHDDSDDNADRRNGSDSADAGDVAETGDTSDANDGSESDSGGDDGQGQDGGRRRRRRRGRDREGNEGDSNPQWDGELVSVAGVLDLRDEGYGFLRVNGLLPSRDDVYVSVKQTRQFGLRRGDWITGASRPAHRSEKNPALLRIDQVNGAEPERSRERPVFEEMTPVFPREHLRLENDNRPFDLIPRLIDLLSPIGKGQRGLIVAPPKAGKTTVIKSIAQAIEANHPDVEVMVLLVDERPEEVTDFRASIDGEVVASTFDRPVEEHIQLSELAIERARRMVELGQDVVVILDGITRLARAHNLAAPGHGRVMSGGLDAGALYPPKRLFGSARCLEEGGSLTILATALVETGSKMDEVIFEEFKGTGNMELRLDRQAAEKRIYPAISIEESSTRHEELLFATADLHQVWKLRRIVNAVNSSEEPHAGLEMMIDRLKQFTTNAEFLKEISKSPAV